jgi:hypothetical protein
MDLSSKSDKKHFWGEPQSPILERRKIMRHAQLNVRMTEKEMQKLRRNAERTGLSISGYIRQLINGYVPKETPPLEYEKLISKLNELYQHAEPTEELRRNLLQIQAEITLPERRC